MPQKDKKDVESITLEDIGWSILKTTAMSAAAIGGAYLLLRGTGFTDAGVRAGSWAARFQSAYLRGTIEPGSCFSILQKAGAKGFPGGMKAVVVGISAVVSVAHTTALREVRRNDETNSGNISEEPSENDGDEETEDEKED